MLCVPEIEKGGRFEQCKPEEATHLLLKFPLDPPLDIRKVRVYRKGEPKPESHAWLWNGSVELPTLTPSIRTQVNWKGVDLLCHSFVVDGKIRFLSDCSHDKAGEAHLLIELQSPLDIFKDDDDAR